MNRLQQIREEFFSPEKSTDKTDKTLRTRSNQPLRVPDHSDSPLTKADRRPRPAGDSGGHCQFLSVRPSGKANAETRSQSSLAGSVSFVSEFCKDHRNEQGGGPDPDRTQVIHIRARDPRPDLREDSFTWSAILAIAKETDPRPGQRGSLFGFLSDLRSGGCRLVQSRWGWLRIDCGPYLSDSSTVMTEAAFLTQWWRPREAEVSRVLTRARDCLEEWERPGPIPRGGSTRTWSREATDPRPGPEPLPSGAVKRANPDVIRIYSRNLERLREAEEKAVREGHEAQHWRNQISAFRHITESMARAYGLKEEMSQRTKGGNRRWPATQVGGA